MKRVNISLVIIIVLLFGFCFSETGNSTSFEIINNDTACLESSDYFYEDSDNKYFLDCSNPDSVYIKFSDNTVSLKESLENNLIGANDLINNGLDIIVQKK